MTMITKEMTINHILQVHPETRSILRRFRLDIDWAGTEPLEQAAWYQGVEVEAILEALKPVVAQEGGGR